MAQAGLPGVAALVGIAVFLVLLVFGIFKRSVIFVRYGASYSLENRKRNKKLDLSAMDMGAEYGQEKRTGLFFREGWILLRRIEVFFLLG